MAGPVFWPVLASFGLTLAPLIANLEDAARLALAQGAPRLPICPGRVAVAQLPGGMAQWRSEAGKRTNIIGASATGAHHPAAAARERVRSRHRDAGQGRNGRGVRYDKYADLTGELAIRGTYCDLAVKLDDKLTQLIEVRGRRPDLDRAAPAAGGRLRGKSGNRMGAAHECGDVAAVSRHLRQTDRQTAGTRWT